MGKKFNYYGEADREIAPDSNKHRYINTQSSENVQVVPDGYGLLMSQVD